MIKVVNLISLLIAPLLIIVAQDDGTARIVAYAASGIFLAVMGLAIFRGKKNIASMDNKS